MTDHDRGKSTDELAEIELVVDLADGGHQTDQRREEAPPAPEADAEAEIESRDEPSRPPETSKEKEIRLDREQTLRDLRELQDLSMRRADGQSTDD